MQPQPAQRANNRRFHIPPTDPRANRRGPLGRERRQNNRNKQQLLASVRAALQQATDSSLAKGTKVTQKSQLAYWAEFCSLFELNEDHFARLQEGESAPSLDKIREEEDVLATFMAFVIACPRKGTSQNTANYALQCISAVRAHYALRNGRRPGLREGSKSGGQLKNVIRGFQKTNPSRQQHRFPILQQHLRAMKECLNLASSSYHKTLWALWLTQWQGVLRSSDLINQERNAQRAWIPKQETHRGRLSADIAKGLQGETLGPRLKLQLKPNKTDQAGVKNTVKTFIIDANQDALSAGHAIIQMLEADPQDEGMQMTPLFRNPLTGKEVTYEESSKELHRCLQKAGLDPETMGTHSLRIGGATAYANANHGGYMVSGFMGLWASESRDWYMHACQPRVDMAALEPGASGQICGIKKAHNFSHATKERGLEGAALRKGWKKACAVLSSLAVKDWT